MNFLTLVWKLFKIKIQLWLESQPIPVPDVPLPARDYLTEVCLSIKAFEGWHVGSRSYRNHNPGNCRFSAVGYLAKYGVVKEDREGVSKTQRGFAIFSNDNIGWVYLTNLIAEKARKHPTWSIVTLINDPKEGYAPASDGNNPVNYASFIGKKLGVNPYDFKLQNLL